MKFKVGDKVKILSNINNHNFPIGAIVKIEEADGDYGANYKGRYRWFTDEDVELTFEERLYTKEEMIKAFQDGRNAANYQVANIDKFIEENY